MNEIKEILKEKGWDIDSLNRLKPSQKTLDKLGISTINHWNKILNGEIDLSLTQAKALSEWLNVPFDRLLKNQVTNH